MVLLLYIFFYIVCFISLSFFVFSLLEWDPMKSCVLMGLGVLFMSFYNSLGLHVWYSYFIVLLFLSGIFSLLTYFCSMSNFIMIYNSMSYYYLFIFFFIYLFFFDFDFFSFYLDLNFIVIYYDFSFYYVFWIIFILFLLLVLVSMNFSSDSWLRGL